MSSKILIVEDEIITAMLYETQLKKIGIDNIKITSRGEDSIEISKEYKPDIIIMDINLSGKMNGIEAAKIILKNIKTSIIFATGYDTNNYRENAMKLNPLGYLVKPIIFKELEKLLQS